MKDKEMQLQIEIKGVRATEDDVTPSESPTITSTSFDVSQQVRLIPQFNNEEVDKFFLHFEKVATTLHWLLEAHTMLLQSMLVSKAREVYSALSV